MFEELELNVTEPKTTNGVFIPTHTYYCKETTRSICSETSGKFCC